MKSILALFLVLGVGLPVEGYEYEVAATAIFQNEAPYLKEWIEYHQLIGVEHFYLYNHQSKDNCEEILAPYIAGGIVELFDWDFTSTHIGEFNLIQLRAYDDALQKAKISARWLAVIDIDEFIVPIEDSDLPSFLKNFKNYGAVCLNWQVFGTSWIDEIPPDALLTESLTLRAADDDLQNSFVKSIVQTKYTRYCRSPHYFELKKGQHQVDAAKKKFSGGANKRAQVKKICINHYMVRDEYFLLNTKVPRYISYGNSPELYTEEWKQGLLNRLNVVEDHKIFKYLPHLKKRMES